MGTLCKMTISSCGHYQWVGAWYLKLNSKWYWELFRPLSSILCPCVTPSLKWMLHFRAQLVLHSSYIYIYILEDLLATHPKAQTPKPCSFNSFTPTLNLNPRKTNSSGGADAGGARRGGNQLESLLFRDSGR